MVEKKSNDKYCTCALIGQIAVLSHLEIIRHRLERATEIINQRHYTWNILYSTVEVRILREHVCARCYV